ncbi:PIN domain-containing protein [Xylanimonas protaetiae]|uniref:PIN domain-containing protein n=1 Tax=Xylanimonas protaetiae TaxID=2509457 RepID=A0A4V0YGH8_9MICO|nr:PIN domain-containing protein [Xylanimonas protaetiae]QAY71261.1 PIN domain-containing protein [Xylanimonas protaetiae]
MSPTPTDTAAPTKVLLDANILFSRTLRDWLFLLRNETGGEAFTILATEDIIAETIYRYRRRYRRASGAQIAAVHDRIVEQLDDRIVDYEIDDTSPLADENDAHVHAAAVAAGIDLVITADTGFTNLDDKQRATLGYRALTADEFLTEVDNVTPSAVDAVTRAQLRYWRARGEGRSLDEALDAADCPRFAARVRARLKPT